MARVAQQGVNAVTVTDHSAHHGAAYRPARPGHEDTLRSGYFADPAHPQNPSTAPKAVNAIDQARGAKLRAQASSMARTPAISAPACPSGKGCIFAGGGKVPYPAQSACQLMVG